MTIRMTRAHRGGITAALALGLALAGCGSADTDGDAAPDATTETQTTTTQAAPETPGASAPSYTMADYIRDNDIVETPVLPGDAGAPAVNIPMPPGWQDAGEQAPEGAWLPMVFGEPTAEDPPTIDALMSKLTGDVDQAELLESAGGDLKNMPGFEGGDGIASTLGGFEAHQIGGISEKDGSARLVAQKTVVIPADDGVFVLQIKADGLEDDASALMEATAAIDDGTTITR